MSTSHEDLHRDMGRMEGRLDAMEDSLDRMATALERIDARLAKIESRESARRGAFAALTALAGGLSAFIAWAVNTFSR